MIRYLFVIGLFICFGTTVFANDMYIQILNAQIEQLTAERDAKRMELDECQDKQKKMKVAGSVTMANTTNSMTHSMDICVIPKISPR